VSREDAKTALRAVIITALNNCGDETSDPSSRLVIADAILDQLTQPQLHWALEKLSKSLRPY
jgi:hypothetical protein